MMLSETGGLRVQVTSPGLGGSNIRVQGMRGRYTQFLTDGLPLYGGQASSLGLLQIPPMDLGRSRSATAQLRPSSERPLSGPSRWTSAAWMKRKIDIERDWSGADVQP
jgi:hypothetical protein